MESYTQNMMVAYATKLSTFVASASSTYFHLFSKNPKSMDSFKVTDADYYTRKRENHTTLGKAQ